MDRRTAAKIGGIGRQTLRDWVHRFNAAGLDGLFDNWTSGRTPRLLPDQMAEFANPSDSRFRLSQRCPQTI
jgi:transposase